MSRYFIKIFYFCLEIRPNDDVNTEMMAVGRVNEYHELEQEKQSKELLWFQVICFQQKEMSAEVCFTDIAMNAGTVVQNLGN